MIIDEYEPIADSFRLPVFPATEEEVVECLEGSLDEDDVLLLLKNKEARLVLAGHLSALFAAASLSDSIIIIESEDGDDEPTTH